MLTFLVVDLPSVYNAILGRPYLAAFGVGELDYRDETTLQQAQPGEATDLVPLNPEEPEKCVQIGGSLTGTLRAELIAFLQRNADIFAWTLANMPGISAKMMVHKLGLDHDRKPVRGVQYPDWLSNVVLVKKSNEKWGMCVDFTDVNKACPKDSFLLPRIDLLVDSMAGHELLDFIDAYSGYNQIQMSPKDEEHTSFMTDQGTYCYKVIPFGLKNAGATYQRLVNKIFKKQIGRNMEVYVDDMLVKSRVTGDHIRDLEESFEALSDFIVETTTPIYEEQPAENEEQPDEVPGWTLQVDGSFTDSGSGAGVILTTPDGFEIKYSLKLDFQATNNVAEYETLPAGLRLAKECSVKRLAVYSDSELVINQLMGLRGEQPFLGQVHCKGKGGRPRL
ncbi:hypothetical protein Nepgr_000144 [Nepenthes gracilis]|uniref:Uncharacterized protein n=1 Tax=Nepenthes gracilis TaxID=150966 RepID=A0AAD3P1J0_NEPGR|nr:hypothetical protein Nepgr_000144 [Nepenthes gracilis]